jgi:hypothetical protein
MFFMKIHEIIFPSNIQTSLFNLAKATGDELSRSNAESRSSILATHCRASNATKETSGVETGREVLEKNSLVPHCQFCMAMIRHAPTKYMGGDLKGHA